MPVANPAGDMLRGSSQWRGGSMMCAFPNADCTSGYAKPRPPQPNSLASGCKTVACGTRAQCAWTWSVHDRCRVLPMRRHTSWRAIAVQCFQLRNRASTTAPSAFRNGASPATRYASGTRLEPVVASAWRRDHQAHAKCNDRAPLQGASERTTRCPHGWPCPARTPCALHPIAHCSLSITIECAGSATFTVLPWTRAPLNATGATACGCA